MIVVRRSSACCVANRLQFVEDDADQQVLAREDRAQLLDERAQLGELVENLLALEARQALELHVENCLRLHRW